MTQPPLPQLPPMGPLTLLRALFKRPSLQTESFETVFALRDIPAGQIKRYCASLGFKDGTIPITYFYLIAQRAQLSTMLRKEFPFRIPGTIHVENDIAEHAPLNIGDGLKVTTTVDIEAAEPSGARYCVLETIGEQQNRRIFTCRSRYLGVRGNRMRPARAARPEDGAHALIGKWRLPSSAGRDYAAISGDWNPIHLWQWSARLMGFKFPIIHGMHTIGKACAVLEESLGKRIVSVSGRFKAPIPLGAEVCLFHEPGTGRFTVMCGGRAAAEGTFSTAT